MYRYAWAWDRKLRTTVVTNLDIIELGNGVSGWMWNNNKEGNRP